MALVSDIQLQSSAVKPNNLDTSKRFSAEGLTATTAFALTDAGAGTEVSTTGQFTAKSANDLTAWFQSTATDGDTEIYISNDARPDWSLKVSGSAGDNFLISNSCSADGTIQGTALSITPAGAVGFGKYGATDALEINALNSASAAIVIANVTDAMSMRMKSESTSGSIGTTTDDKIGFMTNATTRGVFDTNGRFGIGTDSPGATLDVRGGAIFNEAGADADFRIESSASANLFFVDGSGDCIGIGNAAPGALLDIDNGGATTQVLMCVNGCICAQGYLGEKQGHTIECAGVALAQRTGLNFVVTDVGSVVDDSSNDATVVCISGASTCVPFLLCDGSTSDPIPLTGGSIGNQLANDAAPCLGGTLNACDNNACCFTCIAIKGCYFGDGSQLTGVSSVPGCFSGDCTIIGCSAGGNVAAGATNVVLYGANAGYNVTTGDNIVAIGSSVALCMTTATDQVIIGTSAGRCVETCAGNVAVGAHAFYNECAGTYNTVVGDCAGHTQKGATTNTFIGALAGALDSSGSGNVFIGYKAGCANTTGSCCLVIGNGTCDLITGDFNGGSLQIDGALVNCGTLTVGVDDTGYDVKYFGASAGAFMLYDESADTLDVRGATAAGPGVLKLTTGELTNVDGGILGRLEFQAPLDSAGTDAILVAASIWAEADGTFAAACNKTDLVFATATSETAAEKMRITSAGNVGIGTTTPNEAGFGSGVRVLSVEGDTTADFGAIEMISTCAGTAGRLGDLRFINMNGTGNMVSQAGIRVISDGANDATAMAFWAEATGASIAEKMRISSDGTVGIGTAAPDNLLTVQGDTNVADGYGLIVGYCEQLTSSVQTWETQIIGTGLPDSGMALFTFSESSAPSVNFLRSRSGTIGTQTIVQAGDSLGEISWYGSDGGDMANPGATIEVVSSGTPAANDMPASLVFSTNRTATTVTEAMRIEHNGLVGIGTTTPTVGLDVVGYGKFHGGSGYATPTVALCGGAGAGIEFELTGTGANTWFLGMENNDGNIYLKDGSTDILTVTPTMFHIGCNTTIWGNLGIGTDVADVELHIETATTYAAAQIESTASNGVPYLRFKNDAVHWDVYGAHGGAGDAFQISGSAGGTFTFTGAGALGIGTSAALGTASQMRSITLGGTGFMMADCSCDAGDLFIMAQNAHYDTDCSWDYIVTDEATRYTQQNGTHVFGVAASGTAGAAVGFTDAVMINCLGNLGVASDGYAQADNNAILAKQTGTASGFRACFTNASYNGQGDYSTFSRAANSGYNMMVYQSNFDVSYDNEFVLRGDGNAYADGTWSDNGADYAEYFESTTGTALDQGKTVVLEGCQIRYYDATAGDTTEDIVGVVRPAGWSKNSMVIGNTAWNMHHDKYLTDDWGVYCLTDVPVKSWTDARGQEQAVYKRSPEWDTAPDNATITCQAERTLNPNYDESCTYISREDRPEWNIIGLLGQVQIATGQITRSNWIKMCDISDDVQLWLIR